MDHLLEIISVILLSGLKFIGAPFLASISYEFTFWESFLFCCIGGWLGILVFVWLSDQLIKFFNKFIMRNPAKRKVFTWKNKMIVKTVRSFGLKGLAIITPAILSIPLGCFLAVRYFSNKKQVILYLSASVLLWSGLLSLALHIK